MRPLWDPHTDITNLKNRIISENASLVLVNRFDFLLSLLLTWTRVRLHKRQRSCFEFPPTNSRRLITYWPALKLLRVHISPSFQLAIDTNMIMRWYARVIFLLCLQMATSNPCDPCGGCGPGQYCPNTTAIDCPQGAPMTDHGQERCFTLSEHDYHHHHHHHHPSASSSSICITKPYFTVVVATPSHAMAEMLTVPQSHRLLLPQQRRHHPRGVCSGVVCSNSWADGVSVLLKWHVRDHCGQHQLHHVPE